MQKWKARLPAASESKLQQSLGDLTVMQRDSRKSAEKAYKRALMLLVREKGEISRKFEATSLVKDRLLKKTDDLEVRLEKAHAEIKRLRTLYKTAQKAMEAQRPTTAAEREKELAEAAKRPMRISNRPAC